MVSYALLNIPAHKNCINCGHCCGPVPVTPDERASIALFIAAHPETLDVLKQPRGAVECPFRDEIRRCCAIHPVRPLICRLFGVTKGMTCDNGNSAEIDGHRFIHPEAMRNTVFIRQIDWFKEVKSRSARGRKERL